MLTLAPRELQVLERVAAGDSDAAIAARLAISPHAVARHVDSIFEKLDVGEPHRVNRRVKVALAYLASG